MMERCSLREQGDVIRIKVPDGARPGALAYLGRKRRKSMEAIKWWSVILTKFGAKVKGAWNAVFGKLDEFALGLPSPSQRQPACPVFMEVTRACPPVRRRV
jgi:hypothetical protein